MKENTNKTAATKTFAVLTNSDGREWVHQGHVELEASGRVLEYDGYELLEEEPGLYVESEYEEVVLVCKPEFGWVRLCNEGGWYLDGAVSVLGLGRQETVHHDGTDYERSCDALYAGLDEDETETLLVR